MALLMRNAGLRLEAVIDLPDLDSNREPGG
jgi:hypothetical protein